MSGFESIMDWANENIPPSNFDTFEDWIDILSQQFYSDGRLPLEEIFDPQDYLNAEHYWYESFYKSGLFEDYIELGDYNEDTNKF